MFALAALPIFLPRKNWKKGPLFLFGTGALLGLCVFDLLPDVFHQNGISGITFVFIVWVIYSLVHLFHSHQHKTRSNLSAYIFLTAISLHCFSSGLFFGFSDNLSSHLLRTLFIALLAHKVYESLAVSSLLVSYRRSLRWTVAMLTLYLLSFPAGVFFAQFFGKIINPLVFLVVSGLALGSLAGCLVFDFLLPSLTYIRRNLIQLGWFAAGVILTLFII
ncbi:MAG: hypothetical protein A2Z20_05150 [Bdellovibrionales bacterium RBG_16_40_8]|nr:MAG: hypothetical protein A2Z20_05150 [Bdellovibrionales bacterium RBG_16_40_8]